MSIELNITYKRGQYRILKNGKTLQYASDYGYILHTKGRDNEPINCYCGLFTGEKNAYIINQYINGVFDEHKIMLYFHDIEQAKRAYKLTTKKEPESIYTVTKQQLEHWLKYGNKRKPVTEQSFIFDIDNQTTQTAFDGVDWTNENHTAAQIIYGWRKEDTNGELTEACTLDAIIHDELEDGAEIDETAIFDALAVENKRLERTAILLGKSLNRTSSALKVVENGIHISKPMRKNGVTNIAIIYELTDGQTVSVLFHNPDTTPNKLKPDDMMIAWRWLLNRKDITIVVAKEKGQDLPIQTIARRVMALVDKNTARFAKANAKKGEETNLIKQLEEENARLEERLEYLNKLAEERENGVNPENIEENQEDANTPLDNEQPIELTGKEFGDFDTSTEQGKKALREKAFEYLNKLADNEEKVFCPALNADVGFTKKSARKFKSLAGDPIKSQIAAQIKQIIAKGKKFKPSQEQYDETDSHNKMTYHYLKTAVKVAGVERGARVVIREDVNGNFHYDLQVKESVHAIMDSVNKNTAELLLATNQGLFSGAQGLNNLDGRNHTATFDETQEKYVLNLFIFDENGNEIKDEETETKHGESFKYEYELGQAFSFKGWHGDVNLIVGRKKGNDFRSDYRGEYAYLDKNGLLCDLENKTAIENLMILEKISDYDGYNNEEWLTRFSYENFERYLEYIEELKENGFEVLPLKDFLRVLSQNKQNESEKEVSGSLKQQRFNPENVKPATTEQVNQAVVIPLRKAENSEQAKEQAQLFLRKELINKHSGLPAVVSGNNLSKMLSGKAKKKSVNQQLHELAIANVDELYKNAIYGWAKKDRDNEPSIKAIHRLFATMRTEQGDFIVKLTVKETTRTEQNNGLYTLETLEIEENTPIDTWVEQHIKHDNVQGVESIQSTGGIYNLIQNVQKVNTSQLEFDINQQQTEQQKKVNIHSIAVFNDFIDYLIDQDGKVDIANKVKDFFSDDKDKEDLAELLNRNIFRVKYSITEEFARKFTPQKTLDFIEKLNNIKEKDVKDLIDYGIKFYARDKAKELTHIVKQPEFNKGYEEELEYLQNTTLERRVKDREERNEKIRSKQYELDKFWREPMDTFLATLPKMKALKARSALNRQLMYDLRSFGYDDLGNSGVFYGEKAKLLVILFNKGGWFMRNAKRRERIKNRWGEYEYGDFREVNNASELVYKETGEYLNMTMTDKAFFEFLENNYQKDKE